MLEQIQDDPRRVAGEGELASDYPRCRYEGNLIDDCASVAAKPNLENKIKKALAAAIDDGVIIGYGDSSDWTQIFRVGGDAHFIDLLIGSLNTAEKAEFLNDYVLTWDDSQVEEVCSSLMSERVNPLRSATKAAAKKILDNHFDFVSNELSENQA